MAALLFLFLDPAGGQFTIGFVIYRQLHLPLFVLLVALQQPASGSAADRLILRNLDFILDRTVIAIDDDGIRLDGPRPTGGDRIGWDEIERGKVALDQPKFDQLLADLGPPLYRLRQRLKTADYRSLAEPAEQLYPRFAEQKSPTAYMVCQATAWSRMAAGQREAAVEPYLRAYDILRSGAAKVTNLPGPRRSQLDANTALLPELPLVWFDAAAAQAALPGVQQAIRSMAQPRPEGVYLYYASLAIAAGDLPAADKVLPSVKGTEQLAAGWREIVLAQREIAASGAGSQVGNLQSQLATLPADCRPAALLLVGQTLAASANPEVAQDGILLLLTLPAEYGRRDGDLAAAGLYHAAAALDKLNEDRASAAVRRELRTQYASTYFGGLDKP
ncbi:MAG: hypothetical protein SFU86_15465 [Pirellulaceae bacterium]|nr:hypothetical protein [Pirellulaceae bacterium]